MEPPVEEASLCANTHITHYHRLLALVQAEQFFKPAGARAEATEWLAWAHFVHWVLVGYAQSISSMLLMLLIVLPLQVIFDSRCYSPWFAALAIHVHSHDEPH